MVCSFWSARVDSKLSKIQILRSPKKKKKKHFAFLGVSKGAHHSARTQKWCAPKKLPAFFSKTHSLHPIFSFFLSRTKNVRKPIWTHSQNPRLILSLHPNQSLQFSLPCPKPTQSLLQNKPKSFAFALSILIQGRRILAPSICRCRFRLRFSREGTKLFDSLVKISTFFFMSVYMRWDWCVFNGYFDMGSLWVIWLKRSSGGGLGHCFTRLQLRCLFNCLIGDTHCNLIVFWLDNITLGIY